MVGGKVIVSLVVICSSLVGSTGQELNTGQDLFDQYGVIFPHGNRNAASHRWATYIIERSTSLEEDAFKSLFSHFCPVSGSPIATLWDEGRRWTVTLRSVSGGSVTGVTYLCCWPCICDAQDWIFVDTKTITSASGERQYNFLVIGNPCTHPDQIPVAAPDVNCDGGELESATLSDNNYVIIGMFHDEDDNTMGNHADEAAAVCQERAEAGYNSGMGQIFIQVAGISPLVVGASGQAAQLSVTDSSDLTLVRQPNAAAVASQSSTMRQSSAAKPAGAEQEPEDVSRTSPLRVSLALIHASALSGLVLVLLI